MASLFSGRTLLAAGLRQQARRSAATGGRRAASSEAEKAAEAARIREYLKKHNAENGWQEELNPTAVAGLVTLVGAGIGCMVAGYYLMQDRYALNNELREHIQEQAELVQEAEDSGEAERKRQKQAARDADVEAEYNARFEERKAKWKAIQSEKRKAAKAERKAAKALEEAATAAAAPVAGVAAESVAG